MINKILIGFIKIVIYLANTPRYVILSEQSESKDLRTNLSGGKRRDKLQFEFPLQ